MITDSLETKDIGRFIRARRESSQASTFNEIPTRRRHKPHLTQADLAELVDVSTVVVSQIEQGRYPNLSSAILLRISRTLTFTPQQQAYVLGLLERRPNEQKITQQAPAWVERTIQQVGHPILVQDPAYGLLSLNKKAQWLFGDLGPGFEPGDNIAVSVFQAPKVRDFIVGWKPYAASLVSGMKMYYAMYPEYRDYFDQMAHRLKAADPDFQELWSQNDPLVKPTLEKQFIHAKAGALNVLQILTDIVEAPGLTRIEFVPADDETRLKFEAL